MRKRLVAGNWKLNNTLNESIELAKDLVEVSSKEVSNDVGIAVCPTFTNLYPVNEVLKSTGRIKLGAQNCYTKESGAYTGEISVDMIKSVGGEYVIIGHSERREYFNESNEFLADKVKAILSSGLTPIFCCGETLEQRDAGIHIDFVKSQLTESIFDLSESDFKKVVIAYEPIWAIGTGVTASKEQAQDMHKMLRDHIAGKYGQPVADSITILYGGSCKPGNAGELFACEDIDGGLIGGASLNAKDFIAIVNSFSD